MKRGEIWWADLGDPRRSEPALRRPVLIVQDDLLTDSLLGTVRVAPLASNLRRGLAIGNVEVSATQRDLPKKSVVLVCQVVTVDKSLLSQRQGSLPPRVMADVDRGLTLALGFARGERLSSAPQSLSPLATMLGGGLRLRSLRRGVLGVGPRDQIEHVAPRVRLVRSWRSASSDARARREPRLVQHSRFNASHLDVTRFFALRAWTRCT
jgi:mRNA interferase MazF